jgi:hypothetical protein
MAFRQRFISVCNFFVLFCVAQNAEAQTLQRQTLSCAGGSVAFGGGIVQMCIGQPSNTTAVTQDQIRLQQGFLQSLLRFRATDKKIFNIYPNPASQNVYINSAFTGDETAIITTIHGQMLDVKALFLNDKTMVMNIANLKVGAYELQIRNHDKIIQSAILIKNQ